MDLELFNADVALLHPDATTISITDLFFSQDTDQSRLDWAAHAFTRKLSRTFSDPTLLWLVPDFLNDFQLQVARRNINARFAKAEPLPRSVAAVFEQIDHAKIKSDGFQVVVVDQTGRDDLRDQVDCSVRRQTSSSACPRRVASTGNALRTSRFRRRSQLRRVGGDPQQSTRTASGTTNGGGRASTGFRGGPPTPSPDRSSSTSVSPSLKARSAAAHGLKHSRHGW